MKRNVEIDSAASSGGQAKYMKYVGFPWPQLEAALSILSIRFVLKTIFFEQEFMKTNEISINAGS